MILSKIQSKLSLILFLAIAAILIAITPALSSSTYAQGSTIPPGCPGGPAGPPAPGTVCPDETGGSGSTEEPYFVTNDCNGENISASAAEGDENHCGILKYLVIFINILSALAGIVIVGSIVVAGIQYSSAGNDPQKVSAAKNRIRNAIIALLFFIFGYGLLNYLVPGGVL